MDGPERLTFLLWDVILLEYVSWESECMPRQRLRAPAGSGSLDLWAEAIATFVSDNAVGMNRHRDDVFIYGDSVIEVPLAVHELSKPRYHVVSNLLLRV